MWFPPQDFLKVLTEFRRAGRGCQRGLQSYHAALFGRRGGAIRAQTGGGGHWGRERGIRLQLPAAGTAVVVVVVGDDSVVVVGDGATPVVVVVVGVVVVVVDGATVVVV